MSRARHEDFRELSGSCPELDPDIIDRAAAYDSDGLLVSWTPESVGYRLIEAAVVFARTPARIGPAKMRTAWPATVVTAQDLVDEDTQARLMRFPHLIGDWESRIDAKTKAHMSREKQSEWERPSDPTPDQYSRAEEALSWPMQHLGDRPLIADAVTLWALCKATGASLRATLRQRAIDADKARFPARRHVANMRRAAAHRGADFDGPTMTRQDAMPGKNFVHQNVAGRRLAGLAIISAALVSRGVIVREDDPELSGRPVG
jgi:hypothetical protein